MCFFYLICFFFQFFIDSLTTVEDVPMTRHRVERYDARRLQREHEKDHVESRAHESGGRRGPAGLNRSYENLNKNENLILYYALEHFSSQRIQSVRCVEFLFFKFRF